jgi:hypothetical protein
MKILLHTCENFHTFFNLKNKKINMKQIFVYFCGEINNTIINN